MSVWGQISTSGRFLFLLTVFLLLCVQLFSLLRTYEYRRGRHWQGSAATFALMLALFLALYDLPQMNGVPLWLWCVEGLFAVHTVTGLCFSTRYSHSRITRASIKEGMDDLPVAGCYFWKTVG